MLRLRTVLIVLLLAISTILLLAYAGRLYLALWPGYEVQGVPYVGWHREKNQEYLYGNPQAKGIGSAAASLIMVTGFWNLRDPSQPMISPGQAAANLSQQGQSQTLEDIAALARAMGYRARITRAYFGLWNLGRFAGKSNGNDFPMPVIVEQWLSPYFPGKGQIFRVVRGVTPRGKEIYALDYVYGINHALSRHDFLALWKRPRRILVIEPKNRRAITFKEPPFTGFSDEPLDAEMSKFLTIWYIAEEDRKLGNRDQAIRFWEALIKQKVFREQLGPVDQVYHYTVLMSLYLRANRYQAVIGLEPQVVEANQDLNGDQPGTSQNHEAWLRLGEAYLKLGDTERALFYAKRAVAINPIDFSAQALLKEAMEQ